LQQVDQDLRQVEQEQVLKDLVLLVKVVQILLAIFLVAVVVVKVRALQLHNQEV
jgi:hypothetical protein